MYVWFDVYSHMCKCIYTYNIQMLSLYTYIATYVYIYIYMLQTQPYIYNVCRRPPTPSSAGTPRRIK